LPSSSRPSVWLTAARNSPLVSKLTWARSSQAASMTVCRRAISIMSPHKLSPQLPRESRLCQALLTLYRARNRMLDGEESVQYRTEIVLISPCRRLWRFRDTRPLYLDVAEIVDPLRLAGRFQGPLCVVEAK